MATLRFRNSREMFQFVALIVVIGVGLIAWRLRGGSLPSDGNSLYFEAAKLEQTCALKIEEAVRRVGPLSQLAETAETPRDPVPAHRPRFTLPPSLSSGSACFPDLTLAEMERATPAELERIRAKVAAMETPGVVLLATSPDCLSSCEVSLVWLDVANQKVVGVKKLQSTSVNRAIDVEKWAASR